MSAENGEASSSSRLSKNSTTSDAMDQDTSEQGSDEADVDVCYLDPHTFKRGERSEWQDSGRTMLAVACPVGGEVSTWVSKKPSSDPNKPPTLSNPKLSHADQTIYLASPSTLPEPLITLYTETYTLFTSLQRIVASSIRLPAPGAGLNAKGLGVAEVWDKNGKLVQQGLVGPPGADTVGHMRRLVGMYLEEIVRLKDVKGVNLELKARYEAVFHIFQLAQLLYLPQDGRGEGLLGEELLDWVNDVDPAPDNTQGNEIMQTRDPWDHPSFWPYITRCLLRGFHLPASSFLRTLSNHPHPPIAKLASILSTHLSLFPRSHNISAFPLDHQFLSAHKQWLSKFNAELATFIAGRPKGKWLESDKGGSNGSDSLTEWEDDFRAVIELMEGKAERVLSEAADWREAVGAWGVLVDVGMRRDDLPKVMSRIVASVAIDESVLDDTIQASLCQASIVKALMGCYDLDLWLAAHLGDVFDKLAMIPDDEERFETSLRDYLLLEYVEVLQSNPKHAAFWRIICDYLSACGDEGQNRLRSHILHVSLGLNDRKGKGREQPGDSANRVNVNNDSGMAIDNANGDTRSSTQRGREESVESRFEHFADIREACLELRLEDQWKMISRIMADRLIRNGQYGIAATMCLQAEDGFALSTIADRIVDAFVRRGPEEYLHLVDTLPPALLHEAPIALAQLHQQQQLHLKGQSNPSRDLPNHTAVSVFAARLAFLSEFRDYLLFLDQGARDRAAGKLVEILTSGIAPVEIWGVLLVESVALLEDPETILSSNDTFELLRILEEVTLNAKYAPTEYLYQLVLYLDSRSNTSIQIASTSSHRNQNHNGNNDRTAIAVTTKSIDTSTKGIEETMKKGLGGALRKLEEVRLAIARNL